MAKCFTEWTVLPHEPIKKHAGNLWSVHGTMPDGRTRRVMTLARLGDGRLFVHNAIALTDEAMAEVEAFGEPAFILVPNGFHRQDAFIFKQRYPQAKVSCPRGARKRVEQVAKVETDYGDLPSDDGVQVYYLDGCKDAEGVLQVRSEDGVTLVFNDAVANIPKLSGTWGFALSPTGQPAVPRISRWLLVKDKRKLKAQLLRLADIEKLRRVIVSHGAVMESDPARDLRTAASVL